MGTDGTASHLQVSVNQQFYTLEYQAFFYTSSSFTYKYISK